MYKPVAFILHQSLDTNKSSNSLRGIGLEARCSLRAVRCRTVSEYFWDEARFAAARTCMHARKK